MLQFNATLTPNPSAAKRMVSITVTTPDGTQLPTVTLSPSPMDVHSEPQQCAVGASVTATVTDFSAGGVSCKNVSTVTQVLTAPVDLLPPSDPGPVTLQVTAVLPDPAPVVAPAVEVTPAAPVAEVAPVAVDPAVAAVPAA